MALIKLGPNVAGISGSIGGTTYARNRAGSYARNRTKPTVPNSTKRAQINALMGDLIQTWQSTLTTAERTAWDNAASLTSFPNRLGEAFTPTGVNLYIRSNMIMNLIGRPIVAVPPIQPVAPLFAPTLAYHAIDGIEITAVGEFDLTLAGKIMFTNSPPLRPSINYYKGPWVEKSLKLITDLGALPLPIRAIADCVAGSRYFFRFVIGLNDGSVSSPSILSCDIP